MTKPDIEDRDVFVALRNFLIGLFPDIAVIQAQQNRAPPPMDDFIVMSKIGKRRLATNLRTYTNTDEQKTQNNVMPTEYTVQVDFYGEGSGDRVQTFCTLFFDYYACDSFPDNVRPLYVTDPQQIPLISGEKQFLERWKTEAKIQINPVVSVPMDFMEVPSITPMPISTNKE